MTLARDFSCFEAAPYFRFFSSFVCVLCEEQVSLIRFFIFEVRRAIWLLWRIAQLGLDIRFNTLTITPTDLLDKTHHEILQETPVVRGWNERG